MTLAMLKWMGYGHVYIGGQHMSSNVILKPARIWFFLQNKC